MLEDDARCAHGETLQLLSALPHLAHAAAAVDAEWRLLALSPVDCADFFAVCDPAHVPSVCGPAAAPWPPRRAPHSPRTAPGCRQVGDPGLTRDAAGGGR